MTTEPNEPNELPRYLVMTAAAKTPASVRSPYRRVAVVELKPGQTERPKMISPRARGIERIVETWERCNVGKHYPHGDCAASRAVRAAEHLADKLNNQQEEAA